MTDPWQELRAELDAWRSVGREALIWWRDDDAVGATPALDRLLDCAAGRPLALAVIPARLEPSLVGRLTSITTVDVLPHGFAHTNHEPEDRKKAEVGSARPINAVLPDIRQGATLLQQAFGYQYLPLFVPPWNRIAPDVAQTLPTLGIRGLSAFTDRAPLRQSPQVNTHVDVLDWSAKKKTGAAIFAGEAAVLSVLVQALQRRRLNADGTDPDEPVGLLTHHLEHDRATWDFLAQLATVIDRHPSAGWISARNALEREETRP